MTGTYPDGAAASLEEKDELRATARKFFEKHSAESAVRTAMESSEGFDRKLWSAMASELGLQGLAIPEQYEGAGFSFSDLLIVLEEMGRALVCAPFLASAVLAAQALIASDDTEACQQFLPGIADGSLIATLAFTDRRGQWNADDTEVTVEQSDGAYFVDGTKHFVVDGAAADVIFVAARTGTGVSLFAVSPKDQVTVAPLETLDMTRRLANVTFERAAAQLIGVADEAQSAIDTALSAGLVALAAEQVGGARRAMEMSVEYAKIREQFGRPIGSFQAIKHKCADMLLEVESSTSAAYAAGAAFDENSSETALLASLAKSYCSEAFFHVAAETIQVHGGIGFTWEHPAHLYFRRAKASEMLFGNPVHHRERILKELGL